MRDIKLTYKSPNNLPWKIQERKNIVDQIAAKNIMIPEASRILNLSNRQVSRLMKRYRDEGVEGLFSKKIGRQSNNRIASTVRDSYIGIVKQQYPDFGPTFAHEKLAEHHGAVFCVETLRQWMISAECWEPHVKPKERKHPLRTRRSSIGELIQIDGSLHPWFENRNKKCTLLIAIDDASSRVLGALFAPVESGENYLHLFKEYFQEHGLPISLYSDKHGIFKVNQKGCEEHETQFSRIVEELDIKLIHAHTPQAKGRVERVFKTLQDRLVKEMRLANINNIDEGNRFLAEYLKKHNEKFSVPPASNVDKHRPLTLSEEALDKALAFKYERIVRNDYSISFLGERFKLCTENPAPYLRREYVDVLKMLNNKMIIRYKGSEINFELSHGEAHKYLSATAKTLNSIVDSMLSNEIAQPLAKQCVPEINQHSFHFEVLTRSQSPP